MVVLWLLIQSGFTRRLRRGVLVANLLRGKIAELPANAIRLSWRSSGSGEPIDPPRSLTCPFSQSSKFGPGLVAGAPPLSAAGEANASFGRFPPLNNAQDQWM